MAARVRFQKAGQSDFNKKITNQVVPLMAVAVVATIHRQDLLPNVTGRYCGPVPEFRVWSAYRRAAGMIQPIRRTPFAGCDSWHPRSAAKSRRAWPIPSRQFAFAENIACRRSHVLQGNRTLAVCTPLFVGIHPEIGRRGVRSGKAFRSNGSPMSPAGRGTDKWGRTASSFVISRSRVPRWLSDNSSPIIRVASAK